MARPIDTQGPDANGALGSGVDRAYATRTWRYMRLAMIGLVVGLGVSIAIERAKVTPGCFQQSISAYYYTPVRGYFVGALIALGVCLICVRGNTPVEDPLLNLAGMFAFVVAFVPTPSVTSCTSVTRPIEHPAANVANNGLVLLIAGAIVLTIIGLVVLRKPATLPARIAAAFSGGVWVLAAVVFWAARGPFVAHAHDVAAVLMFLCIVGAAAENAFDVQKRPLRNVYAAIGGGMACSLVGVPLVGHFTAWHYWTIVVEVTLIALFAAFWVIQTSELWKPGLRPRSVARSRREYRRTQLFARRAS